METIEIKKIIKKVKQRNLKMEDYDQVVAIQLKCFPGMKPWTREEFESLITLFPEGQFCIQYGRKIIASSCSLVLNFDEYGETASWGQLTDNGKITNHNTYGDTLYGMEMMVDTEYRGY